MIGAAPLKNPVLITDTTEFAPAVQGDDTLRMEPAPSTVTSPPLLSVSAEKFATPAA
jgi:hypothetical protein